ncbi:oxygen-insensitive NADPH nitroreductase [Oceanobacillus sp. J11TS1]|uniref:oxygen-insensitive NADPH nitroreductase n=1 Tax=Oceanobacillus sp. J11TS1 TaxID=2807191 RepID=UPI001B0D7CD2|nr:oxygen-insensitive NADPH nitroreductase [Oceanobacillus sp. J11TS1]GIO22377.1 FMN reductase (NADPH) [Oceanobacillus sp. J11TS1]
MNQIIETIMNHRSIRKFADKPLSNDQIKTILESAQRASTSSNVMAYSIIGVSDQTIKEKLYAVSGHYHVKKNGHLLIFCADLHRIDQLEGIEHTQAFQSNLESTEQLIVGTIDAALAAQNAAIAAESLGLGICYLGSLRNDIQAFNDILQLPSHVVPLFGLAIGYPKEIPDIKPRLPLAAMYHVNQYIPFEKQKHFIQEYDQTMQDYYKSRSSNNKQETWTEQINKKYAKPTRMDVGPFVQSKNLNKQ